MKCTPLIKRIETIFMSPHSGGHSVHSPWFYELISGIEESRKYGHYNFREVEEYRLRLTSEKSRVNVTDYGTGRGGNRSICNIVRVSSVTRRYASVIAFLASRVKSGPIIELGTSLGISAMTMALANRDVRVITVEGSPVLAQRASEAFESYGIRNVEVLTGEFDAVIKKESLNRMAPEMVLIDGNHNGEATLNYFNHFLPDCCCGTMIVIDDIDYSVGMRRAWRYIRSDKRVSATVDAGRMGVVFFRKGSFSEREYSIGY